jgi:uncharacterized protein with PhoU and TrkA domain
MDTVHSLIFVVLGMQSILIVYGLVGLLKIAGIAAQVEETAKNVAEMVDQNRRMTQSILQKVYEVSAPQA